MKNVKAFAVPTDSNDAVLLVKGYNYHKDFFEMWIYDALALQFKAVPFNCYSSIDWSVLSPKRFNATSIITFIY